MRDRSTPAIARARERATRAPSACLRRLLILPGALALLAACEPREAPDEPAAAQAERVEVLAPIESADLEVRESAPPQYALRVVSGLPSGCVEHERIDVERRDAIVEVAVWNTMPADEDVVCTMIYRTVENVVELGSDFEPGTEYTVRVNRDTELTFTAQ